MRDLSEFQAQAASMALVKLLTGATFYITDVDAIAKVLGVQLGGPDYDALKALHCVRWAEMPESLRSATKAKVIALLGVPPLAAENEQPAGSSGDVRRLAFWRK